MKKLLVLFLILGLSLVGCSKEPEIKTTDLGFQEYLDELLIDSFDPSDIGINFSFINPEDFGINPEPYYLGFVNEEDYLLGIEESAIVLNDLKSFKDVDLNSQEIIDRDALIANFEQVSKSGKFYEYEIGSNVLGYSRAFSGNVPAYLETYDFHNEEDVIGYLNFLETLETAYESYLNLEKQRQESGRGYGQEELDKIIDQAQDSVDAMSESDYFLIEDFQNKIKELNLEKESEYIEKQKKLVNEDLSGAYQLIVDELSQIEAKPTTGLANKPDGKEYYEYLLQSNTGSSRSVKDVRSFIKKKKSEVMTELSRLSLVADYDDMFDRYVAENYGDFTDGYDLLDFIDTKMQDDFPEIGDVNYEIRSVHPSMKEASSPAFYFTPYTDYNPNYKQTIYINGEFDNSLYQTYAHEGLPGHMYQFNYFLGINMHPIRTLYTESSNAEGWANYIEAIAHSYVEEDEDFVSFAKNYNELVQILHIEMDLGINYDGWDLVEFKKYLDENFSAMDDDTVLDIYMSFTHNPAVFPTYYLSSLYIQDMKDQMKMALGSEYSEKEFHRVFLDSGSVGFDLIQGRIDAYLEEHE